MAYDRRFVKILDGRVIELRASDIDQPGCIEIPEGVEVHLNDETDDGGQTFKEREPEAFAALRALGMAVRALAMGDPVPQRAIDEIRKLKEM